MKNLAINLGGIFLFICISSLGYSAELSINSMHNSECKIPSDYARIVKVNDEERIVFNQGGVHFDASDFNNILECYGLKLTVNVLESEQSGIPRSYAKLIKQDEEKSIKFSKDGTLYGPSSLNSILNAYGVTLSPEALKDKKSGIPSSYAKIIKTNDREEILFSNSSTFYSPSILNDILVAYK